MLANLRLDRREIEDDVESGVSCHRHKSGRHDRAIDTAADQCRGARRRIADLKYLHVPIRVHAPLADKKSSLDVGERAVAADRNFFAFHVLGRIDARAGDEQMLESVDVHGEDLERRAGGDRIQNVADGIIGNQRRAGDHRLRRQHAARDVDHRHVEPLFLEEALFLGEPDHLDDSTRTGGDKINRRQLGSPDRVDPQ